MPETPLNAISQEAARITEQYNRQWVESIIGKELNWE